ncbi:MAG: tetratricopeptide repeat protein [Candidatus Berkelbacteria bacterium]|nr:MAG: tetratricopeptide repeat protein [Candidatus Berkelbacteria bacterium]QQG51868.1 MAG: tetratricopeptide repeat protein [Candidatus Berkelbacteria bacterium]
MTVNFEDLFEQAWRIEMSGHVTDAVAAYRDIAELSREDHDRPHHMKAILGAGRSAAMAISPDARSYYRDSLALFSEGLQEAIQLQDQVATGVIYHEMARAADAAADFASAAVFFQKALETLEKNEAIGELAATYADLGSHLSRLGQLDGSIQMLEKALSLFNKEPLSGFYQARARVDFAITKLRKEDFDSAKRYLEEAISWFEADHGRDRYTHDLARTQGLMAIISRRSGDGEAGRRSQAKSDRSLKDLEAIVASRIQTELRLLERV